MRILASNRESMARVPNNRKLGLAFGRTTGLGRDFQTCFLAHRLVTIQKCDKIIGVIVTQEPSSFISEVILRPTQKP
jgi:hypothetical protein